LEFHLVPAIAVAEEVRTATYRTHLHHTLWEHDFSRPESTWPLLEQYQTAHEQFLRQTLGPPLARTLRNGLALQLPHMNITVEGTRATITHYDPFDLDYVVRLARVRADPYRPSFPHVCLWRAIDVDMYFNVHFHQATASDGPQG
jgi:hypothetical protein